MKGALDVVLRHCHTLPNGSVLTAADKKHFEGVGEELGLKGLRGSSSSSPSPCITRSLTLYM